MGNPRRDGLYNKRVSWNKHGVREARDSGGPGGFRAAAKRQLQAELRELLRPHEETMRRLAEED